MRNEGQWVHWWCSSLDRAVTVRTLTTQALPGNSEDCLKNHQMFQVFWTCWACLIVSLASMPINHTQDNFSICSLQGRSLEMYFVFKNENSESQLRDDCKSWGLWEQGRAHVQTAGVGKGAVERAASLGREWGWMERKARRAEPVSRFGFPGTIGERQRSLPAPAETKSPYTTTAKSAFLFVCVLWGLGGQVLFDSCIPTKTWSPLPAESRGRGAGRGTGGHRRARTVQTAQEGPHSFPVNGLYKTQFEN